MGSGKPSGTTRSLWHGVTTRVLRWGCGICLTMLVSAYPAGGAEQPPPVPLADLGIEDLLNVEFTTTTKMPRMLFCTAAAASVITQDDIRSSGATTLMDLLRMVPGVQVAQVNTDFWAISIRGFNGTLSNKVLVIIDGRSVYSPLFSNVFWREHDLMLEDIDHIEIIRGPGGTIWGANAVNGIVNIITKHAADTQGGLVTVEAGHEVVSAAARYGGATADGIHYRIFAKAFERGRLDDGTTGDDPTRSRIPADNWQFFTAGVRLDWDSTTSHAATVEAGWYRTQSMSYFPVTTLLGPPSSWPLDDDRTTGVYISGEWRHSPSKRADFIHRAYYTHQDYDIPSRLSRQHTIDLDSTCRWIPGEHHTFTLGAGYRITADEYVDTLSYRVRPESDTSQTWSAFAQDEIALVQDRLTLTLGSKVEHNDRSGLEYQPSARMLVTPSDHHAMWTAITRAVRTPNRLEADQAGLSVRPSPPGEPWQVIVDQGNDDLDAERVLTYEIGYRFSPSAKFWADLALFHTEYEDLIALHRLQERSPLETTEFADALADVDNETVSVTQMADNILSGHGTGGEIALAWHPCLDVTFHAAYGYMALNLESSDPALPDAATGENTVPVHSASLMTRVALPWHTALDVWIRYVDEILDGATPEYTTGDVQLSWRGRNNLLISLVGQNVLFDQEHAEFDNFVVDKRIFAKATIAF